MGSEDRVRRVDERLKEITPQGENFSQWYVDVIIRAQLADYAPVRGMMAIRPDGYAIWEFIQKDLDARFKATGHRNAYFPLLIPESLLEREAQHVEGFAPEVAWVESGGSERLEERLAIRPTSEAIIGAMYARWVQSYRDLPVLINQWCNVLRWEKATRPFLRTTEFLWQDGHTCHADADEARTEARTMLEVYRSFIESQLAIPVLAGSKSEREKFAGAEHTYTCEALMRDGRALQAATSHELGQRFAQAFGIRYLDRDGVLKHPYQTSWGASTRLIGALIMVHGDDHGLRLPPRVAPVQVVVVPIAPARERARVLEAAARIRGLLGEHRVVLDDREEFTPGWKFNEWELRGVPLRVEIGPRDLAREEAVLVRRDGGEREVVAIDALARRVPEVLDAVQAGLFRQAQDHLAEHTRRLATLAEVKEMMGGQRGMAVAGFCGQDACELRVKEESGATLRLLADDPEAADCLVCGRRGTLAYWARAY